MKKREAPWNGNENTDLNEFANDYKRFLGGISEPSPDLMMKTIQKTRRRPHCRRTKRGAIHKSKAAVTTAFCAVLATFAVTVAITASAGIAEAHVVDMGQNHPISLDQMEYKGSYRSNGQDYILFGIDLTWKNIGAASITYDIEGDNVLLYPAVEHSGAVQNRYDEEAFEIPRSGIISQDGSSKISCIVAVEIPKSDTDRQQDAKQQGSIFLSNVALVSSATTDDGDTYRASVRFE